MNIRESLWKVDIRVERDPEEPWKVGVVAFDILNFMKCILSLFFVTKEVVANDRIDGFIVLWKEPQEILKGWEFELGLFLYILVDNFVYSCKLTYLSLFEDKLLLPLFADFNVVFLSGGG